MITRKTIANRNRQTLQHKTIYYFVVSSRRK